MKIELKEIGGLPALKYAKKFDDENFIFCLQYEPQVRTLISQSWTGMGQGSGHAVGSKNTIRLSFPYLVFVIRFVGRKYDRAAMAVTNEPITSINDHVYRLPLSNIYKDPISMGLCMMPDECKAESITDRIKEVVTAFWSTSFTGHTPHTQHPRPPQVGNLDIWKENTRKDPSFITKISWQKPVKTGLKLGTLARLVSTSSKYNSEPLRTSFYRLP